MVLESIVALDELKSPGYALKRLQGDRAGQHATKVNDQYRVCFVWNDGAADDVEVTDYH